MNVKPARACLYGVAPPYRVDLGDIVARRRQPDDLIARFEAVTMSHPALHPWREWASEPITPGESGLLMVWTKSSTAERVRS